MAAKPPKEKGHTAYHPKETFSLSVDWILRNEECLEGMLRDGLQGCARATLRDTPCVPTYFFRKAYDQSGAKAVEDSIKTVKDHPHYDKVLKALELEIPRPALLGKLKAAGIDPQPLDWDVNAVLNAEAKAKIGLRPVRLSLSELYLDSRAFFEHADSKDYLQSYGVVMEGHRSLKASTRCLGTPSDYIFDTVLSPYLQAIKLDSLVYHRNPPPKPELSFPIFLEFCFIDVSQWREKLNACFDLLQVFSGLGWNDETKIRVEIALYVDGSPANWHRLLKGIEPLGANGGQLFCFQKDVQKPDNFPSSISFITADESALFGTSEGSAWAGYVVHPLSHSLNPDESVVWKRQ